MVGTIFRAVGLWLLLFVPGGVVGVVVSKTVSEEKKMLSGVASQVTFILTGMLASVFFTDSFKLSGLVFTLCCALRAVIYSGVLTVIIMLLSIIIQNCYDYEPSYIPRNLTEALIVALLLAPFSEELMYRGVIEGYLLLHSSQTIAIIVPALLFSLMHLMPFNDAPRPVLVMILSGAFLLGVIAGYYRALSNSIIPAFASHATANALGLTQYNRGKINLHE